MLIIWAFVALKSDLPIEYVFRKDALVRLKSALTRIISADDLALKF